MVPTHSFRDLTVQRIHVPAELSDRRLGHDATMGLWITASVERVQPVMQRPFASHEHLRAACAGHSLPNDVQGSTSNARRATCASSPGLSDLGGR